MDATPISPEVQRVLVENHRAFLAFLERRDGIEDRTDRYLLDLRSRW